MPTVPPPPPLPISTAAQNFKRNSIDQNNNKLEFSECLWAVGDSEVQRACFFARTCLRSSPKECVYLKVNPILQTGEFLGNTNQILFYKWKIILGPTCGLCALSMLYGGTPSADDILVNAVDRRYSNNGEMFSAQWLLEVLKENLSSSAVKPEKIRSYIFDGPLDSDFIKDKLQQHCMLLVPYDADRNHSPCNQNGHKAHWCLICGYLVEDNNDVSWVKKLLSLLLNLDKITFNFLFAHDLYRSTH